MSTTNPFRFNLNLPDTPQGVEDQNLFLEFHRLYLAIRQLASQIEVLSNVVSSLPVSVPVVPTSPSTPSIVPSLVLANTFFSGPNSGSPRSPNFRLVEPPDFPTPRLFSSGATIAINWRTALTWSGVIKQNSTFAFIDASDKEKSVLKIVQYSVGGWTLTL